MRLRRPVAACLVAVAAVVLGACGGGSSTTTTGSVTTVGSETAPQKTVVVNSQGGNFDPAAIYQSASPGVVTILSIFPGGSLSGLLGGSGGSAAEGSGFVVSQDGQIATNAHVVTDAESGGGGTIHEAKEVYVEFGDRNRVRADIVGFDPNADVALLKVDPAGLDLRPLQLATNEQVEVGQPVAAIGSPFEEQQSLSIGIVSATDRSIDSLTRFQIEGALQTDASINPGNSGGPLLDADAHVIGINQQISTTSGGNEGVGFAVPIDLVARSLKGLAANGQVKYAYIGVSTEPLYPQLAERLGIPTDDGALIASVKDGSPAAAAGLQGSTQQIHFQGRTVDAGGDVIVAVDGQKIVTQEDLPAVISRHDPGETVTMDIIRDGKQQTIDVKLGERPDSGA
jgi:S1-C subfamily serine protease